MRKNARIIQISGLRGLLFALFVVVCLIMGFVTFPGIVAMCIWNMAAASFTSIPQINVIQGILLWVIIALSIYMSGGGRVRDLMTKIRTQAQARKINAMLLKSDELKDIERVENKEFDNSKHENDKEKL